MFELQRNWRDVAFELLPLSPDFKFAIVLMIISEPSTQSSLSSGNLQIDAPGYQHSRDHHNQGGESHRPGLNLSNNFTRTAHEHPTRR